MSGVYIKLEMPKGCAFCKISRRNGKKMVCPLCFGRGEWDIHDPMSADHRLDDCPLVHVPAHGRLVDADALEQEIWRVRRQYQLMDDTQTADKMMHGVFRAERLLQKAPTIIPADWEGEGVRTMSGGPCLHYDCSHRNSFGYCKTTVCINEHYQQEQWGSPSTTNKSESVVKKPQTNYDRLISKTPEELARFLTREDLCALTCGEPCIPCDGACERRMLEWLKATAEEVET